MKQEPHWLLGGQNGHTEITVWVPKGRKRDAMLRRARELRRQHPDETHRQIAARLGLKLTEQELESFRRALRPSRLRQEEEGRTRVWPQPPN